MCELRLDCWFRTRIVEQTRNDVPGTLDRSLVRNRAISAAVYQRPMCGISGHVGFAHAEPYFDDLTDGVVDLVSVACLPAAHVQQLAQGIHRAGMVAAADASRSWFPDPRPHRAEQSRAEVTVLSIEACDKRVGFGWRIRAVADGRTSQRHKRGALG